MEKKQQEVNGLKFLIEDLKNKINLVNQSNNNQSHDMELDSSIERNRSKDKCKLIF